MVEYFPSISIVTPSLNQGQFIEETIQSVLSQNYPALEYLIMDGGSQDETVAILEKYSGKVTWVSEKDDGQTDAINKGLMRSSGAIVSYLNADDILLPGALQLVGEMFMQYPGSMWLTGLCKNIDAQSNETRKLITYYKNFWLNFSSLNTLLITDYIAQPATFWRKEVIDRVGFPDPALHFVMDYEYWLRLFQYGYHPIIVRKYIAGFRIQRQSKTSLLGHQEIFIAEEEQIIQKYTKSKFMRQLHKLHRFIMTSTYKWVNS